MTQVPTVSNPVSSPTSQHTGISCFKCSYTTWHWSFQFHYVFQHTSKSYSIIKKTLRIKLSRKACFLLLQVCSHTARAEMWGCRALPEDNRSPKRAAGADKTAGRSRLTCTSFSGRALVDTMYTMHVCAHARAQWQTSFFVPRVLFACGWSAPVSSLSLAWSLIPVHFQYVRSCPRHFNRTTEVILQL